MGKGEAFFLKRRTGRDFTPRDSLSERRGDPLRAGWARLRGGWRGGEIKRHGVRGSMEKAV
jgi:hypothetical protein